MGPVVRVALLCFSRQQPVLKARPCEGHLPLDLQHLGFLAFDSRDHLQLDFDCVQSRPFVDTAQRQPLAQNVTAGKSLLNRWTGHVEPARGASPVRRPVEGRTNGELCLVIGPATSRHLKNKGLLPLVGIRNSKGNVARSKKVGYRTHPIREGSVCSQNGCERNSTISAADRRGSLVRGRGTGVAAREHAECK